MSEPQHRLEFEATDAAVRRALIRLRAEVLHPHLSADLCDSAEIVLAEILNNIVEHAAAGRPDGRVRLTVSRAARAVSFELQDNGAPMPGLVLPAGAVPDLGATADLPEGGFGWHLIRNLAPGIAYHRSRGWNRLTFSLSEHPSRRRTG